MALGITGASGRDVLFSALTPEQADAGLTAAGLPPVVVDALGRFQRAGRSGAFDLVGGDIERLTGKPVQSPIPFLVGALQRFS